MRDDIVLLLLTLTPVAQVYPASARLMGLLSIMEARAHTVSRLRRDLRALYETSPSPQAWLMAARVEAQLAGGAHRMQVCLFVSQRFAAAQTARHLKPGADGQLARGPHRVHVNPVHLPYCLLIKNTPAACPSEVPDVSCGVVNLLAAPHEHQVLHED